MNRLINLVLLLSIGAAAVASFIYLASTSANSAAPAT